MRILASDILKRLEDRVAKLEKEASNSTKVLENLKKLVKIPFGKERYKRNENYFINSISIRSNMDQEPMDINDYEGFMTSYMNFSVSHLLGNENVDEKKVQSELEKEVKKLASNSSILKEKAKKEMDSESESAFTSAWYDTRHYDFSYGGDGDIQVSVKVKKGKDLYSGTRNMINAEIKISQKFDIEEKGEYGEDVI